MKKLGILASLSMCFSPHTSAEAKADPRQSTHSRFFGQGTSRCPWSSLTSQGFSGPTGHGVTIRFLGTVPARRYEYFIYAHTFINPESEHGHERIIVMERGCKYAGQYYVMAQATRIRGNDILFNAPIEYGNVIRFSNRLPPAQAWIDGEVHEFMR
jgi:hypothetical protein